jgi:DNA recombination protein RmuC
MNTSLLIGLVAFCSLLLGFIIGNFLSKLKAKQLMTDLEKKISTEEINSSNLKSQKTEIQSRLNDKTKEVEEIRTEK